MALDRLVDNIQVIEAHLEYSAFLFHIIGKPKESSKYIRKNFVNISWGQFPDD